MIIRSIKKNNETQSGQCCVYYTCRKLSNLLMPFHFSIQRTSNFFRRFFCLSRTLLSFSFCGASCQDLVQHHFLDDFPRDAIFFPFLWLRSWRNALRHYTTIFLTDPGLCVLKDNQIILVNCNLYLVALWWSIKFYNTERLSPHFVLLIQLCKKLNTLFQESVVFLYFYSKCVIYCNYTVLFKDQ